MIIRWGQHTPGVCNGCSTSISVVLVYHTNFSFEVPILSFLENLPESPLLRFAFLIHHMVWFDCIWSKSIFQMFWFYSQWDTHRMSPRGMTIAIKYGRKLNTECFYHFSVRHWEETMLVMSFRLTQKGQFFLDFSKMTFCVFFLSFRRVVLLNLE